MPPTPFTHLHLHTQYSLLDGAIKHNPLFERVKALGMSSVAMTDHGNLFGAVEFYEKARASGVKPILGCEVYLASGKPLSEWQSQGRSGPGDNLEFVKLSLEPATRQILHERIEQRLKAMLNNGFLEEVKVLRDRPRLTREHSSMRAVGYRQVLGYLRGEYGRDEMIARGVAATRQLAKRQLTWLRADPQVHWLDEAQGDVEGQALTLITPFLRGY